MPAAWVISLCVTSMKNWIAIPLLAVCSTFVLAPPSSVAQEEQAGNNRQIVTRIVPNYPSLARNMRIGGLVKVEAVVAPNGTVKSVEIKGGHPVLAAAAADAVRQWKWIPAARESKEPVIVKFDP
jgi:TonB family protein